MVKWTVSKDWYLFTEFPTYLFKMPKLSQVWRFVQAQDKKWLKRRYCIIPPYNLLIFGELFPWQRRLKKPLTKLLWCDNVIPCVLPSSQYHRLYQVILALVCNIQFMFLFLLSFILITWLITNLHKKYSIQFSLSTIRLGYQHVK